MKFAGLLACALCVLFFPTASAKADCVNPADPAGMIRYNTNFNVMQYCDGTNWIAMGKDTDSLGIGLVGHWKLDEASGVNVPDSGGGGYDGTINGSVDWRPTGGVISGKLNFLANDSYVQVASNPTIGLDGQSKATFAAWIYPRTFGENNQGRIVDKGGGSSISSGYTFQITNAGSLAALAVQINSLIGDWSAASNANVINVNTWQHVAAVYDGAAGNVDFYVNGQPAGSDAIQGGTAIAGNAQPMRIGRRATDVSRNFDGFMDDVRVYNRALSAADIQSLYNMGVSDGLVAGWHLDETSGTTAVNFVSAGLNGTMQGGLDAANDSVPGQINTALDFDNPTTAVGPYINAGNAAALTDLPALTVSMWLNPDSLVWATSFAGKGNNSATEIGLFAGWQLVRDGNGFPNGQLRFRAKFSGGDIDVKTSGAPLTLGIWNHLALTWDGSPNAAGVHIYVNGVETGYSTQQDGSGTYVSDAGAPLTIAATPRVDGRMFNGAMDEVRVYNRALTPAEILTVMAAGTDCTDPFGKEGETIYNTATHLMQYCNGANWVAMGAAGSAALSVGPANGLVGYWKLDEASGNLIDSAGSNDGTPAGGPQYASSGVIGNAMGFDGADDIATVGSDPALEGFSEITLSAWIYPTANAQASGSRIISKSDGGGADDYALMWNTFFGNSIRVRIFTSAQVNFDYAPGGGYSTNQWYHFVGVYDGSEIRGYVNGVQVGSPVAQSGIIADSNGMLSLGAHANSPVNRRFSGLIDDAHVYNRALSDAEIQDLYNLRGNCANPAEQEGAMIYNADFAVMQYCNGTDWVAVGK